MDSLLHVGLTIESRALPGAITPQRPFPYLNEDSMESFRSKRSYDLSHSLDLHQMNGSDPGTGLSITEIDIRL